MINASVVVLNTKPPGKEEEEAVAVTVALAKGLPLMRTKTGASGENRFSKSSESTGGKISTSPPLVLIA